MADAVPPSLAALARASMAQHGLLPELAPAALAEAAALPGPAAPPPGTVDLRHLLWCSIDNDDSRDLDQLTVAEPRPDGGAQVLVAIAEVDSLVRPTSALDHQAGYNTTSVYTAAGTFPMLPERLSTDLTSLNEDADRLALVVDLAVDEQGAVDQARLYLAQVRNWARLTYRELDPWLAGSAPPPPLLARLPALTARLRLQDQVARALLARRRAEGVLELDTPETRPLLQDGAVVGYELVERGRSRELISAFMEAANAEVARYLHASGCPTIFRAARAPRRWERIVALAAARQASLPEQPDAPALAAFLTAQRLADPAGYTDLSLAVLKLIGGGEYVVERAGDPPAGHFGLARRHYAHATAPNRRYSDLVTQRLLKAALAGQPPPYDEPSLEAIADQCTRMEDAARKVERQVGKAARSAYLASRLGQEFDAVVTGAAPKGTWVRVAALLVEGLLISGHEDLDVGDQLRVRLAAVDPARGHVDFVRA